MASLDRRSTILRLLAALGAILVLQVIVLVAGDSRFSSSTDAGGRAASIGAASATGGCDHGLGYWAADADPDGEHHPLVNTSMRGDRFVQPAALAYACPSAALVATVGHQGAFVLPILGVVAGSVGAWLLARRAGSSGWLALLAVGAVGPLAFYGTDTWEHAPATGAALLATALLVLDRRIATGLLAGAVLGTAATLRIEVAIVGLGLGVALLVVGETRRDLLSDRVRTSVFGLAGAVVVVVDRILERQLLGGDVRGGRALDSTGQAASEVDQRVRDALVNTVGFVSNDRATMVFVVGAAFLVGVLVLGGRALGRVEDRRLEWAALAIVVLVYLDRALEMGWVPGAFVASPMAAVGLLALVPRVGAPPLARALALAAVLSLPIVWLTQWTGAHTEQWAGRYQLTQTALLATVGAVLLAPRWRTSAGAALVASTVLIGALGLGWHTQRTQDIAAVWDDLAAEPCDGVIVSASMFFLREAGSTTALHQQRLGGCHLLSATPGTVGGALDVAATMGEEEALIVYRFAQEASDLELGDWVLSSLEVVALGSYETTLVRAERVGPAR